MDWGFVFSVVVTGLIIVFIALIGLTLIMYLSGKIIPAFSRRKTVPSAPEAATPAVAPAAPVRAAFIPPVGPGPVAEAAVEDGIAGKTVAAITAAVTTALEGEGSYKIKSIKRSDKK